MTDETERKKGELIDLMAAAAARGKPLRNPATARPAVAIKGNGNIVGNHNQVHVTVHQRPAAKVVVTPGPLHISPAQAAEIKDMIDRLAKLQGHTHQKLWTTLKRRFNLASYHLAPLQQFPEIHAWLRARLAKTPAPRTRKTLLASIHAEARKHPGGIDQVKATHNITSLTTLTDQQLHHLATTLRSKTP